MNIALDVMGGDNAPQQIVEGAVLAAREFGVTISLVGKPEIIERELEQYDTNGLDLPVVAASQVIEMDEKPARAVREKPDNSMAVACRLVKSGEAQAFVTAGNTGGALTAGILQIGRIKGISRPALLTPFPTRQGFCVVLDVGANADVRPEYLPQFAVMGSIYAEEVLGRQNPSVRILSNGEEEGKGNQLVLACYQLLEQTPNINFQGNIESQEVIDGLSDVVVTDGFTGNIFVKTTESVARMLLRVVFEELTAGPINRMGMFLSQNGLRKAKARMDDSAYGGAMLLGLSGLVIVAHGRSDANTIRHAIRIAKEGLEHDIPGKIAEGVAELNQQQAESVTEAA